mgnify:CR=1 FL=1
MVWLPFCLVASMLRDLPLGTPPKLKRRHPMQQQRAARLRTSLGRVLWLAKQQRRRQRGKQQQKMQHRLHRRMYKQGQLRLSRLLRQPHPFGWLTRMKRQRRQTVRCSRQRSQRQKQGQRLQLKKAAVEDHAGI